ncbi:phosphotransferase [Streptomyces sp. SID14478]|uniref:phosphotransferase n=1 Tax=Streptomyces sp. SID14478 TaxID=2706073 RepID=UPI0013DF3C69|nr:phosphotransferase [Streptomyces sp. SID14478]NEB81126.1 phosphotransferase [Streptomyces sp. SID14478]
MRVYSNGRTSAAWRSAVELCGDASAVEGPLTGSHHETYVFPLRVGQGGRTVRWKSRAARAGLVRFDRRCFASEADVVRAVSRRVRRVPEYIEVGGAGLQRFIEGETLGRLCPPGDPVPDHLAGQIVDVFRELVSLQGGPGDGDTAACLDGLVSFVEEHVYEAHADAFAGLFRAFGIDRYVFRPLRRSAAALGARPFCLVHGDLHRENLIIDARGELWVIDWELAMFGDPLYDLATHLHLMRYPETQEREVTRLWCAAVEEVAPGSSAGWHRDLPLLLGFKRAQSVFTDVIRCGFALRADGVPDAGRLWRAAVELHGVLARGAVPLGLPDVPAVREVAAALADSCRGYPAQP